MHSAKAGLSSENRFPSSRRQMRMTVCTKFGISHAGRGLYGPPI